MFFNNSIRNGIWKVLALLTMCLCFSWSSNPVFSIFVHLLSRDPTTELSNYLFLGFSHFLHNQILFLPICPINMPDPFTNHIHLIMRKLFGVHNRLVFHKWRNPYNFPSQFVSSKVHTIEGKYKYIINHPIVSFFLVICLFLYTLQKMIVSYYSYFTIIITVIVITIT